MFALVSWQQDGASSKDKLAQAPNSGEARGERAVTGNGIIDTPTEMGGWSILKSQSVPIDSDRDGMPEAWEKKQGLDPSDSRDGNAVAL